MGGEREMLEIYNDSHTVNWNNSGKIENNY